MVFSLKFVFKWFSSYCWVGNNIFVVDSARTIKINNLLCLWFWLPSIGNPFSHSIKMLHSWVKDLEPFVLPKNLSASITPLLPNVIDQISIFRPSFSFLFNVVTYPIAGIKIINMLTNHLNSQGSQTGTLFPLLPGRYKMWKSCSELLMPYDHGNMHEHEQIAYLSVVKYTLKWTICLSAECRVRWDF